MFLCNISLQHFFRGLWSQQEFPSSETGLTYTIARAGLDSCRRRHHQTQAVTPDQHQQQQLQRQSQRKYGTAKLVYDFPTKITCFSFVSSDSLCSSGKTQSTAVATQKLSQDWNTSSKLQVTPTLSQTHSTLSNPHSGSSHFHHQHSHHHHHSHNSSQHSQQQQATQHQYVPQIQHQHQHHHQHLNNE